MWDIKPADEKALDRYEGFPKLYRKEYFSLEYGGETHKAMAYVMNSGQICEPSQAYYNCILEGYKALEELFLEKKKAGKCALYAVCSDLFQFEPCGFRFYFVL